MATIVDYASLSQALQDFPHRTSIASFVDYFIGGGHERIASDIYVKNDGTGVKQQQQVLNATVDPTSGYVAVPTGFQTWREVRLSIGGQWQDLEEKEAAWIYENYPEQTASGPPAYIATDTVANASFTGSIGSGVLTVSAMSSGFIYAGPITGTGIPSGTIITAQASGTTGGVGNYTINNSTLTVGSEAITSGGDVFIFGPFTDGAYQLVGTYFGNATVLSGSNTTNWLVQTIPYTLLAACMIELCYFIKDQEQLSLWKGTYDEKLTSFVLADKAKRFQAGGMAVALPDRPVW